MEKRQMDIYNYIEEEVSRQGHDISAPDGKCRIAWMYGAWKYAHLESAEHSTPTLDHVITLGKMIEPVANKDGLRSVGVRVGSTVCPHPSVVRGLLYELWLEYWNKGGRCWNDSIEVYKEFEKIHPFVDGNGRVGKILLNWLNGTLGDPIFPPHDLFGSWIRNP